MQTLLYPTWNRLEISEQPVPAIAQDEVLLKVSACGICGSELESYKNRSPRRTPPLIMGHEFCGTVVETGTKVSNFKTGDRVVSNSVATCGVCKPCNRSNTHLCEKRQIFGMHRQGAFTEFVNVPTSCLIRWPENVPAEAACLAEPLANGIHVANLTRLYNPQKAVVIGAGPIGLMCQQAAQILLGAKVLVTDFVPERLAIAMRLGAEFVVNAKNENLHDAVKKMTDGEGADLVIDAAGSEASKKRSLQVCRPGGAVVWIGLHENEMTLNSYDITLPEKSVFGSYAAKISELEAAVQLMETKQVDVQSWVKTFALNEGVTAFNRMLAAERDDVKAVLVP